MTLIQFIFYGLIRQVRFLVSDQRGEANLVTVPQRLLEIRSRLAELKPLIAADASATDLDDTGEARFDGYLTEWDTLTVEAAPLEARQAKVEAVASASLKPGAVIPGTDPGDTRDDRPQTFNVRTGEGGPFNIDEIRANPGSPVYAEELRSRALKAVDTAPSWVTDDARQAITKHVESRSSIGTAVARHTLIFGSPEYQRAFDKVVKNPLVGPALLERDEAVALRAAMAEGTTTAGGFMVPVFIDPTIILTNNGATNPIRGIATVKTIATQTWKGVTSAGVTAEWTAEANEVADASPTIAQPSITPVRADAYLQASFEMLDDTNIAEQIAGLIADAKDRLEATAFAVGTGSTQPKGVVTAVSAVTASRVAGSSGAAGAADFVLADVYALANALPPRHRPNSSWLGEQTTLNKIRRFGEGTTANAAFWADLGMAIPSQLLGRPVYESSEMDNTIVSGSNDDVLLIGDFAKFYVVDRIGLQMVYEPLVKGSNRRPTGEVGWAAFWRVGSDCVDTNAFRLLRL